MAREDLYKHTGISIDRIDHIVLTVKNIEETVRFYTTVLGMEKIEFGQGRVALKFGRQKINLHQAGKEIEPKATAPTPGSADLCLITETSIAEAMDHIKNKGIPIVGGPVNRTGANGLITSFYFRDPDGNLIEVSVYS
ncbi:MAG TPA: VOC family protein [Balneolales bacterium]|nr:VOC family protein [Balneolales bacterium]